jgi:iron complex outermembrane receptor protein
LSAPGIALAQTQAVASPSSEGLADITVTAQRYEQRLQDTPLSVVAVDSEQLAARGVDNLAGFDTFIPNLSIGGTMAQGNAVAAFAIRGIGGAPAGFITQEGAVGVYIDDVLFARPNGALLDLLDVERVEVLRGPQGTLFGRNTAGGAIRYVSKMPDLSDISGNIKGVLGNFSRRDISGNLNIPIGDTLAFRFSAGKKSRDGHIKRVIDGDRQGDQDSTVMRGQLRWRPTSRLDVVISADTVRTHDDGTGTVVGSYSPTDLYFSRLYPNALGAVDVRGQQARATVPASASPSGYTNAAADAAYFLGQLPDRYSVYGGLSRDRDEYKSYGLAGTISYELSDTITAKSLTGYRDAHQIQNLDWDRTPLPIYGLNDRIDIRYLTQELQLTGNSFDSRLKWVAGAFYYWDNAKNWRRRLGTGGRVNSAVADDLSAIDPVGAGLGLGELERKIITTKSLAFFGQGSFNFTERLSATLGLRWNRDSKNYEEYRELRGLVGGISQPHSVQDHWSNLSPRFGLEYKWTDDVMTYVSAAKGFKGGGFNDTSATVCPPADTAACGLSPFKPENLWTYEVGIRSDLFDRKVRFNLTGFYTKYQDQQIQYIDQGTPTAPPTQFTVNGDSTVKGLEAEFLATPITGLLLRASLGYVDARYDADILGINSGAVQIAKNSPYFRSPKWSYSLGANYTAPVEKGQASIDVNWGWKDSQAGTASPTNMVIMPSYGLLNGRIAYSADAGWSLALVGTNLLNKYYLTGGFDPSGPASKNSPGLGVGRHDAVFGFNMLDIGRPREWAVELSYNF